MLVDSCKHVAKGHQYVEGGWGMSEEDNSYSVCHLNGV